MTQTHKQTRIKGAISGSERQYAEQPVPYYFSVLAREREQEIRVGDYVRVRGLHGKYELMDIFPRYGSVRVREVGRKDEQTFPWSAITPWKKQIIKSKTVIQAIGNWLFGGSRVFRLSVPTRMLKQRRIHWDTQTCDVEDEDGKVLYGVPWDDLEFWNPQDYHIAGDE